MIHNYIKDDTSGDHWGVSQDGSGDVLVQVQMDGEQVRIKIDPSTAFAFAEMLQEKARLALSIRWANSL